MSYFDNIESKTDRMNMRESWEYDKKAIKLIATVGSIIAIGYYISTKEIKLNQSDSDKPLNNIEAILVTDENKKRFVNKGIKIRDMDRSDSEKIVQKKYSKFINNNYNHNNRKMQIPIRCNEYASNNNVYRFFPNDRRRVERYNLIIY